MKNKLLYQSDEWTLDSVEKTWAAVEKVAKEELGLDFYPPQIELITFDQMLDAYSNIGLPTNYSHWSFGKDYIANEKNYREGKMGLAYEMVINSNPAVCYCLETNTSTMQALVLAHAACGHVHFFKNNYLFKEWTDADGILPYMKYAKEYIEFCSERYGNLAVETILDAAHSLKNYGVDLYKRKKDKFDSDKEIERLKFKEKTFSELETILPKKDSSDRLSRAMENFRKRQAQKVLDCSPEYQKYSRGFPEENLLYFLEKKSLSLPEWAREILRIVRNVATYFYPQAQTKVMNEGFASAIHYTIMNSLYDKGCISAGNMLEFLNSHTSVCCQRDMTANNPYKLGFSIFMDLKRICLEPTEEDYRFFPTIAGTKDWLTVWKDCVANYRDESFILQFLSPKVIRDLKLMHISVDYCMIGADPSYLVENVHSLEDVHNIRRNLANQYKREYYVPALQIVGVEWDTRRLLLKHVRDPFTDKRIDDGVYGEVESYLSFLWGEEVWFDE